MTDQPSKAPEPDAPIEESPSDDDAPASDRGERGTERGPDRGLTDFVRRAVSAGVGAASRSKDDIMRAAASEVRTWLDRLDVNNELLRALSKMVIEVKTEIRFRPTDDGRIASETSNEVKIKSGPSGS
jgi:hypothetical protein